MSLFRRIRKQPVEATTRPENSNHPVFREIEVYEETIWYADNEEYAKALSICLPSEEWNEFANQAFYQDMMEYLRNREVEFTRQLTNKRGEGMDREELRKIICQQMESKRKEVRTMKENRVTINQMAEDFVELLKQENLSYISAKEVLKEAQKKLQKLAMERPLN